MNFIRNWLLKIIRTGCLHFILWGFIVNFFFTFPDNPKLVQRQHLMLHKTLKLRKGRWRYRKKKHELETPEYKATNGCRVIKINNVTSSKTILELTYPGKAISQIISLTSIGRPLNLRNSCAGAFVESTRPLVGISATTGLLKSILSCFVLFRMAALEI